MKLEGLHHITMITGDAQANVDFYADVLGLRLVKKTVNFDAPDAYHLYFGDEPGSPGSILTWFEFAGARPGRAGAGMIHTIQLGVASEAALDFWAERLAAPGYDDRARRRRAALRRPRRPRARARRRRRRQPAAARRAPRRPGRARDPRRRGRPRLRRARPGRGRALLTETLGFTDARRRRVPPPGRRAPLPLGLRPAPADARPPGRRAPCTTSPGTRATTTTSPGSSASARPAASSPTCATATTSTRSTSASRTGILFEIATTSPGLRRRRGPRAPRRGAAPPDAARAPARRSSSSTLTPVVNPRDRASARRRGR